MGANGFSGLLTIGAVLLALWLDMRIGNRRPESPLGRLAHAFAAFVVLKLATAGFAYAVHRELPKGWELTMLFLLFFPGLIYAFVAGVWLTRTFVDVARLARR
jgi:hypothetical protein